MALSQDDRNTQIEFIINVYKSTHGVKPRHIDFDTLSDAELDNMADTVAEDDEAMSDEENETEGEAYERGVKSDARLHSYMTNGWSTR
jgi:predicted neutral ceramidase superfamily lipid hydrolase